MSVTQWFLIFMGTSVGLTALGVIVGKVLRDAAEAQLYEVASYGEEDET